MRGNNRATKAYRRSAALLVLVASLIGVQSVLGEAVDEDLVNLITGQNAAAENYDARYRAADALGGNLSSATTRRLIDWLTDPSDPLPPQASAAIRNAVAGRLIQARLETDLLAAALQRAFLDPRQSEAWRDYCLQKTGLLLRRLNGDRASTARDMLWRATEERAGALAGTALIALQRNIEYGVQSDEVADRAVEIASDGTRGGGDRATALQILVEFGDPRALSPARAALESSRDVVLRLASLGVVGTMGTAPDVQLVERYAQSSIPVLRSAAAAALSRLDATYNR